MKKYFILHNQDESGIRITGPLTHAEICEFVNNNASNSTDDERLNFLDYIPEVHRGYFISAKKNPAVVIKGELILPIATKVAIEYEIE